LNENQSSNKNTLLFNHEIEAYNNELNFINYNIPSLSNFLNNEYTLFLLFTLLGGSLLMSSSDIISVYLSIELQSFGVYLFSALHREQESSISAALKYYLLGSLSSCFILMGGVLLYSYTGLTQLDNIYSLISLRENSDMFILYDNYLSIFSKINLEQGFLSLQLIDNGINLGLVLILCGFFFKISAAPFHS
jgi:NADH-ubiquinone oxidoreductase chain 2